MTEKEALQAALAVAETDLAHLNADHGRLMDTLRDVMSVLCWYADPARYDGDEIENDEGHRARQALAKAEWPLTSGPKPP